MSINNGVKADADHFNGAFLSRTVDTDTLGKVDLLNAGSDTIIDVQSVINDTLSRVDTAEQDIINLEDTRVTKAVSSIDNTLVRFDGVTGQAIQGSGIVVDDSDNVDIPGDVVIHGNATILGTTTSVNSDTLEVTDANVTVNVGGSDVTAQGAGLTVERTGTDGSMVYDSAAVSRWKAGDAGSEVEIATISGAQVITNKDIDGATASNTNRITVPKGTLSALNALTRKEGTIVYATDTLKFYYDDGTSLIDVSGGSTSAIDNSAGVASAGLIIKTAGDGFLDKTFNNTIPSFSSEASFVTFLGRAAIDGDRFYDTTAGALKIYIGAAWVSLAVTSVVDLDDLSDVVISSPVTNQLLKYNGTNWVNTSEDEPVYFTANKSANQTGVNTNNTEVKMTFNTATEDSHSGFDTGTSEYTIPTDKGGTWVFRASAAPLNTNILAARYNVRIYKNGSTIVSQGHNPAHSAGVGETLDTTSAVVRVSAGDTIEARWFGAGNNSASTLTIQANTEVTYLTGYRIGS